MGHYHAEVWVKRLSSLESRLEPIMDPFYAEDGNPALWDSWTVGGYFVRENYAGYAVPQNAIPGVSGVSGKIRRKRLLNMAKSVTPVSEIPHGYTCYALIVGDDAIVEEAVDIKAELTRLGVADGYLVTVDMHL